jgi:hypothetical protein
MMITECEILSCSSVATHALEHHTRGHMEVCRMHAGLIMAHGQATAAMPISSHTAPLRGQ